MAYPPATLAARTDASPGTPDAHAADHTEERDAINDIVAHLGPSPQPHVHTQASASATWTIDHNKGRIPSTIYVEESTGDDLEPGRSDPTVNQTVLDFDGTAVSGFAIVP